MYHNASQDKYPFFLLHDTELVINEWLHESVPHLLRKIGFVILLGWYLNDAHDDGLYQKSIKK
jgi:hypothetical protein